MPRSGSLRSVLPGGAGGLGSARIGGAFHSLALARLLLVQDEPSEGRHLGEPELQTPNPGVQGPGRRRDGRRSARDIDARSVGRSIARECWTASGFQTGTFPRLGRSGVSPHAARGRSSPGTVQSCLVALEAQDSGPFFPVRLEMPNGHNLTETMRGRLAFSRIA